VGNNLTIVAAVRRDYYDVLGIPRDADAATIKRAFHAQARQWHPDLAASAGAEERFRELAEAYSVLSRRDTRALYDKYGYQGVPHGVTHAVDHDADSDIRLELELPAYEAFAGGRRLVAYQTQVQCTTCAGRGMVGELDPACELCGGLGYDPASAAGKPCPVCFADPCAGCGATGVVTAKRRLRVVTPPGVESGSWLRVTGEGHASASGVPGDLLVHVHVGPPPKDRRTVRYVSIVLLLVAVVALALYLR